MGCIASEANNPGAIAIYSSKSPVIAHLSDKNKDQLTALIQKDDILGLAVAMSAMNALPNSQISDDRMRWMLTHLCCRWDADNCLQYLLKDYFCQNPSNYIDFVNAPTIEGYTCLHLCALWQSEKCFYVIHNLGGLNLNAKDKTNKTPYQTACQYRCKKMKQTLQVYRGLYVNFTHIQTQRLISKELIAEDIGTQMKDKEKKAEQAKKITKKVTSNEAVLNTLSALEKQMLLQKQKLQKQKQQILQERLRKQMAAQVQKKNALQNKNLEQHQKIEYQRKVKEQVNKQMKIDNQKLAVELRLKQDELQRIKNELKMAQQQRIHKQKEEAQKKAEQFIRQRQQQIDKKVKQKQDALVNLKKQEQLRAKRQKQQADKKIKQIQQAFARKQQELNQKLKKKQEQIQKIKKDQEQRIKKQKQNVDKQTQQAINKSVLQYSKKLKQKQEQAIKLKQQETLRLRRQKQEAEKKAKEEAKEKSKNINNTPQIQTQTKNQNPQPNNNVNNKTNNNTPNDTTNELIQAFKKINQQLPPQILLAYTQAKKIGIFFDKEFPGTNQSMGDPSMSNFAAMTNNTVWLRPKQFIKSDFQLFNGIQPNDIKQGSLGVCYMLATISVLAQVPKHIERMFIFSNTMIGFYILRFYINGKPKYVIIDDLIPCNKTTKSPLFTKPIGNQIWVLLLEKAWAKNIGDYLSAESMTPDHMMQDLSSAPSFGSWFEKDANKSNAKHIKTIINHSQMKQIVVITSGDKQIQGIANNHAYSMLQTYQINGRYIFKIRNPWGKFEWNGQYNDKSSLWTPQLKQLVKFQDKDDGVFYLTQNQLTKAFVYYSIGQIIDNNFYSYTQFTSKKNQDLFYKIKITKPGNYNIRVTQLFDRMVKDKSYKYSPIVFQVGKIISDQNVTFISQGHQKSFFGAKSVHAFQNITEKLQAGQYFIRIRMLWQDQTKYNTAVLASYGPQTIKFEKLPVQKGVTYLKSLLFSNGQNIKRNANGDGFYKICTMKGQFVFVGETIKDGKYKMTLKFNKNQMTLAALDIGKTSDVQMLLYLSANQPGIGTAMRTEPAKGGSTGPVSILIQKV